MEYGRSNVRHAVIEAVAARPLWVSITATTGSKHQCEKQNLRSKAAAAQKKVAFLVARGVFGWLRSPLSERKPVCPGCPPQRDFGDGSPSTAGLISACAEGGGTALPAERSPGWGVPA